MEETHTAYTSQKEAEWPRQGEWTYEDYARLPNDGYKYEVMKGVLHVAPAPRPRHQRVVVRLSYSLVSFVEEHGLGEVLFSPIDVILPEGLGTPVQPDLLFIAAGRLDIVGEQNIEGAPDLVVEVLSPSNWVADRRDKLAVYAAAGVREYWIVDPDQRTAEVFVLANGGYRLLERFGAGETVSSQVLEGFSVAVDAIIPA